MRASGWGKSRQHHRTSSGRARDLRFKLAATPGGRRPHGPGDAVYTLYAKKTRLTHAQCWVHSRRKVFEAKDIEPAHAEQALEWIGTLYAVEAQIRENNLTGPAKHIGIVQGLLATCQLLGVNPTTTSWTSCSASASIPQGWCSNSHHGSGKSCTPPIRYAPICTTCENANQVNNAGW
jgi:hypothetical protein